MDYSALTEAQQQQYQQQYQQYQQEQHQYHQQQQAYDPAQAQAYEAYYAAYHQTQQYDPSAAAAAYQAQQYYPHDYSAYQPPQPAAQPDPTPAPHDPSQFQNAQHQNPYPQQQQQPAAAAAAAGQEQQAGTGYQVPAGLNPAAAAAVAALSQLTQFAGTMDAAERAMAERQWHEKGGGMMGGPHHNPMQQGSGSMHPAAVGGRSPYSGGGGRKRGGPSRGGRGRGNFGHSTPRQDGVPPTFRGRGRGRMGVGGGRRSHQSPAVVESWYASQPAQAPAPKLPRVPLLPVAWCDICRVDCNSLDILEQHKNGKRHKKTVKRFEERQAQERLMAELPAKAVPKLELVLQRVEENKSALVGEANKALVQAGEPSKVSVASESILPEGISVEVGKANKIPEVISAEIAIAAPAAEAAPHDATADDAQPTEGGNTRRPRMDGSDRFDRKQGPKRKMMTQFGRGGKRLRSFEPVRSRPIERSRERPRYCTVCNVMCDTQAVFECHLSGKKHISRIKRFQSRGAVFGPVSVYIPPNQPTASQGPEPLFYGLTSHETLQQDAYARNDLPLDFSGQQGGQASQAREAEGAALVLQSESASDHPKDEVYPANGSEEDVKLDTEGQNAVTEYEAKEEIEDALPVPDYGSAVGDNVVVPGLDVKVEEPEDNVVAPGVDIKVEVPGANAEELGSEGATAIP